MVIILVNLIEKTPDQIREGRRQDRNYYYVVDPDTKEVQRTFGQPKLKPKAVIYLPHYEDSLRIEVDLPDGKPEDIQKILDDYKDKFINWFGGNKQNGYNWGNKTRRWAYNKIGMKIQGVKIPREDNRALRTMFMYKGLLEEFKKGKSRKAIVQEIAIHKRFEFEQIRRQNKISRKTGIVMKTTRKEATINRDITSLVKMGILRRISKGKYEVNEGLELKKKEIDGMGIKVIEHEKKK
jgi:hypothetical protein